MGKCSQCGVCCRIFWINLDEEEYKSGKFKTMFESFGVVDDFGDAEIDGSNILAQHDNGSCIYLKDGKCLIYDKRPEVCRKFFCDSEDKKFEGMIKKINEYELSNKK